MTLITGRIPVDGNRNPVLAGVSSSDGLAVVTVYVDPTTHALLTSSAGAGTGDVNVKQINGVTPLMGNGVTGTGSQRVTVASDNTPFAVKIDQTTPGTTNLVALAANQSVNVAQINGVTTLMGNGATGTGSQRVTIASDNTVLPGVGAGATGAAIPANAVMMGLSDGTNLVAARQASNAFNSTAGGAQIVALAAQLDDTAPTTITENSFGNLRITANRALMVDSVYSVTRVTADTQVKATAGFVHTITISPTTATPTAGLLTLYDSAAESGTAVFSEWFFATDQAHTITLDCTMGTGIYVGYDATLANVSCTVTWR